MDMNDQIFIGIVGFLGLLVFIQFFLIFSLISKLKTFTRGQNGASLEDTLNDALHTMERLEQEHMIYQKKQKHLEKKISNCIKAPATVRFNPFQDAGGNQSFASSFVSESGRGVIISSLYAQGKTSIFAKPISEFDSKYELTKEEAHVLQQAKNQVL